jgi:HK97 family phage portal protein
MIAQNSRILWLPEGDARHWDYESGGFSGGGRNPAGVRIDPETALRSTVVLACVRVLSSSVAGLPLHLYRRTADGGKEIARDNPLYRLLHDRPNSWQTSYEWREQLMLHLLTHGQAFVEISGAGPSTELIALHPSRMKVERLPTGRLRYTYREDGGSSTVYAQDAIMHLRWLSDDGVNGMVPVEIARDAIGLARACEIHGASFFANGARPGIVLTTDQVLSPEAAENTRSQWERAHRGPDKAQRTAVLQGGLKISEVGGNNQESQFLESRRFQVEEICRVYGVPPHLVGDLSRSSFSNIEQQSLDYVQNGLMPFLRRIESAIARDLVTDDSLFAEFDVRGALRADAAGRASYYNAMWNLGVLSVNEIRAAENLNPVEGGDTRFVQLNMTTLEKAVAQPEPVVEEIMTAEVPSEPAPAADAPTVLEVLEQYRSGGLTIEGAKALLVASFPGTPQPVLDEILAGVVVKEPGPEPVAEPEAPAPEPIAEEAAAERALPAITEGQWVTWGDGLIGKVDHVMTEGVLNQGDIEVPATPDAPVMLVSVWADGEFTGQVPVMVADATVTEEPEQNAYGKKKRKPAKRDCGTGSGGFKPGNKCGPGGEGGGSDSGGSGSGGDSGGSDSGGDIAATRERQAKEREAWKSEKTEATKELNKQEKKDTAKLDREYERELSGKIQAAGKEHDKETNAKVREVAKEYAPQIEAAGSDVQQVLSVMDAQGQATDAVRTEQDKAWRAKSETIRKEHDAAFGEKYDKLRQDYDAKHSEMQDRFDAKREEIQAKHDAEREQVLSKKPRKSKE